MVNTATVEVLVKTPAGAKNGKEAENEDKVESGLMFFVANLKSVKDFEELKDCLTEVFSKKNLPVQDVFIGVTKKFGFLDFSSAEEVEKANSPAEKSKNAENKKERDARTLFVKSLPYSIGVNELQEIFGNAKDIRLPVAKNRSSKGIAYVEFNTEAEADAAMRNMQGTEVDGRPMLLNYTGEKSQHAESRRVSVGGSAHLKKLFVTCLSEDTTKKTLKEAFEGSVSARIAKDKDTGASKGFGFVKFSTAEDAKAAREAMKHGKIDGKKVTLDFAKPNVNGRRGGACGSSSETVKESGKRKRKLPINVAAPEKKKQKREGAEESEEEEKTAKKIVKEMAAKELSKEESEDEEGLMFFVANLKSVEDFEELKDSLREVFSKKNLPVQDVFIGVTKKFGFLDFSSAEEVEKANSPAEKSKNAENKKERDARTLLVKSLPYSIGVNELQEIFRNAKDIRLPVAKNRSSKGIAYVEFNTETEADAAMRNMQGTEVDGRPMLLNYTGEKSQHAESRRVSVGDDSKVLVVKNLAFRATEDSLQEVFEKATSIKIPKNKQRKPKGHAFVKFSSVEEAKEALESYNDTEIEGRSIRIEFSLGAGSQGIKGSNKLKSAQFKTLIVNGLSEDTTEETLKEAFDRSVSARIAKDKDTDTSMGFGFVEFSTNEDAKAAKKAMKNGKIDGKKVALKFAKPKGDNGKGSRGAFGGKRGGGRGSFGVRRRGGRVAFGSRGGACMSRTGGPL